MRTWRSDHAQQTQNIFITFCTTSAHCTNCTLVHCTNVLCLLVYILITFVQRRPNVFDIGPTLYKCYKNVLCSLGEAGHVSNGDSCVIISVRPSTSASISRPPQNNGQFRHNAGSIFSELYLHSPSSVRAAYDVHIISQGPLIKLCI